MGRDLFALTRKIKIDFPGAQAPSSMMPLDYYGSGTPPPRVAVMDMCFGGGADDTLAIRTAGGEMLTLDLSDTHEAVEKMAEEFASFADDHEHGDFKMLSGGFGMASITAMDAIAFPPLMVTASADRMVSTLCKLLLACELNREILIRLIPCPMTNKSNTLVPTVSHTGPCLRLPGAHVDSDHADGRRGHMLHRAPQRVAVAAGHG